MADYFSQCSVLIPYDTSDEFVWLENELRAASGLVCTVCKEDEFECTCDEFGITEEVGGFVFEDQALDADSQGRRAVWVHDDAGYVSGGILADVVARFQREFQKPDFWECQFSLTCSKPRLDGFGGYSVLVHHGKTYWFSLSNQTLLLTDSLKTQEEFEQTLPAYF